MEYWLVALPLVSMLVVVAGAMWDARVKRQRRAAYLQAYPTLSSLKATLDAEKYRTIRATRGEAHAIRAIHKDYPGIKIAEATEVARSL